MAQPLLHLITFHQHQVIFKNNTILKPLRQPSEGKITRKEKILLDNIIL
jgi:hypothetical protein